MHQAKLWATQVFKNEGKVTADTFIQHHRASQPWPSLPLDTRLLIHSSEKQPAKADHLSVACFEYEFSSLFIYHSVYGENRVF